jgi:hypothetical protein
MVVSYGIDSLKARLARFEKIPGVAIDAVRDFELYSFFVPVDLRPRVKLLVAKAYATQGVAVTAHKKGPSTKTSKASSSSASGSKASAKVEKDAAAEAALSFFK